MEELLIEEKAKRYDSMFERLKEMYNNNKTNVAARLICERYFPELKECEENEDEMIRKELISLFQDCIDGVNHRYTGSDSKRWLAWLRKQGEHANFLFKIQVGDKVTRNEDGVLVNLSQLNRVAKKDEKQGEQKPTNNQFTTEQASVLDKHIDKFLEKKSAWSEKYIADVFEMVGLAKIVREQSNDNLTNALQDAMIELSKFIPQPNPAWSGEDEDNMMMIEDRLSDYLNYIREDTSLTKYQKNSMKEKVIGYVNWLKSLKGRVQPQPVQEWSEEDERVKIALFLFVESYGAYANYEVTQEEMLSWLKSLRPQSTWKPSERQKEALLWCVVHLGGADKQTLGELLEELNKL